MHWDTKNIFKTLPFFNTYIDKPDIKKNIKNKTTTRVTFL